MKHKPGVKYCTDPNAQLIDWVEGTSKHNEVSDECCPDFSCCRPRLKWPLDERKAFVEARERGDEQVQTAMIQKALGELVAITRCQGAVGRVHLAGVGPFSKKGVQ